MCHNKTPPASDLTPPRRKNRSKTRKPKYLSLRLQLNHKQPPPMSNSMTHHHEQQQLNLFPLHPELNLVDDKLDIMMQDDHNNVAFLFTSSHGAPASLNTLLRHDSATTTTTEEEEEDRSVKDEENGRWLLRKAMKRGSKLEEEERWVCYSEVTSYCSANTSSDQSTATTTTTTSFGVGLLSLKLDYEGVLNAWSHQRSLYVPGDTPLPLPNHHLFPNVKDEWGNKSSVSSGKEKEWEEEEELGEEDEEKKEKRERERKMGQREASVLRYKQKRESRLFCKRIRYEVRKLNAEKRPRMKGRFVKRD